MTDLTHDDWAMAFARRIRAWRFLIIAVWGLTIAAGLQVIDDVAYDPDVLVYFDRAGEARQDFERVAERFGRAGEVVTLVVPDEGAVNDPAALRAMAHLTALSLERPEVTAVRSILSEVPVPLEALSAMDDEALAEVGRTIEAEFARSPDDLAPLLARDRSLAAVAAIVEAPADNDAVQEIARAHRALRDEVAAEAPDVSLLQTGRIVIDDAFLTEGQGDVDQFLGAQFLVLLALLFLALGSLSQLVVMGALVFAILAVVLGVLGSTGLPINGISSAAPAVLMGLMVATSVHVVMAWQDALRAGANRLKAVAVAFDRNARAVAISIATTMISFLLLNIAESPPFRQLGNIVALGLVAILLISFTLLPALLMVAPRSEGRHRKRFEAAMGALGAALVRRWRRGLFAGALVAAASIVGVLAITIDDTFSHYFDERYEVRRATDLFETALSGTTIVDLAVDTGEPGDAVRDQHLSRVAEMVDWLEGREEVARTASLVDVAARAEGEDLARLHEAMVAEGVPAVLSQDLRHSRISIVMRGVSSQDTLRFAGAARAEAASIFEGEPLILTGMPILSARLSLESARAMFVGMGLALAAISLVMVLALKSLSLGLVSLLPNLLPVLIAFGLWGAFAGEVSFAATVVGALTYGIVVDDTVHILAKYRRFRLSLPLVPAVRAAFRSVGVAVVVTSLALGLSFLPFALSGFLVNRHFGALTALTLLAAMIADLLLLPAVLAAVDRWRHPARTAAARL